MMFHVFFTRRISTGKRRTMNQASTTTVRGTTGVKY